MTLSRDGFAVHAPRAQENAFGISGRSRTPYDGLLDAGAAYMVMSVEQIPGIKC
jgi:hypothetical protein